MDKKTFDRYCRIHKDCKYKVVVNLQEVKFDDGFGGKESIRAPSLILMFQSDALRRSFERDPKKEYSIYDLMALMEEDIKLKEVTIASNFERNKNIFEKIGTRIESRNHRLSRVVVVKLKPVCKNIFYAIELVRRDLCEVCDRRKK